MKYLPKVTQCTHSPDLISHWPHSPTLPDHPLELKLTSGSSKWHPGGTGAGDFALFSPCTRKDGKELWRQPAQKVEDRADAEAQLSSRSIPNPEYTPSFFTSGSFLSSGEDLPFTLLTNIYGAQHNPELWKHLKMSEACLMEFTVSPRSRAFFKKIFSFYNLLLWVFVAARRFSLVAASGGYSSLRCVGFSLRWLLLSWSTGCRRVGFSSCGTWAQ